MLPLLILQFEYISFLFSQKPWLFHKANNNFKICCTNNSHFTPTIFVMRHLYEKLVVWLSSSSMENKRRCLEERKISSLITTTLFSQSVITRSMENTVSQRYFKIKYFKIIFVWFAIIVFRNRADHSFNTFWSVITWHQPLVSSWCGCAS